MYIQEAALSSALSKADPAGIGTRANISTLEVNQNQDNEKTMTALSPNKNMIPAS